MSAGALTAGLAGCIGIQSNETNPTTTDAQNSEGTSTGAFASDVQLDGFDAADIRIGQNRQRVQVDLSGVESGEEIDLHVDFTSLTEANIGTQDLGVVAETSRGSTGWLVSGAEISEADGIVIRVTVEIEDVDSVEDFASVNIDVTGLRTEEAEHREGLEHSVTLSTSGGEPDFTTGETAVYDVIDPEEIENVLRVSPSDIRVGETSQHVSILIERATEEVEFRLELAPLRELGAKIGGADVMVEETAGERRNDEGEVEIDVTQATIVDGVVQLSITTTADTLVVDVVINGLDTEDAEATSRLTYPVYTGERPEEPIESGRFSISGAVA